VFYNSSMKTYMHVLYREAYCLCLWVQLQKHEELTKQIVDACRVLESVVMQVFVAYGWRFCNRLTAS
jgi:hypothetical protein